MHYSPTTCFDPLNGTMPVLDWSLKGSESSHFLYPEIQTSRKESANGQGQHAGRKSHTAYWKGHLQREAQMVQPLQVNTIFYMENGRTTPFTPVQTAEL